jgi:hypothetical protein
MNRDTSLWMTSDQANVLHSHLFPGDGKEAAAVALCGLVDAGSAAKLTIHHLQLIPHAECLVRRPDKLVWPTDRVVPLLNRAEPDGLSLVKFHSHLGGNGGFSVADDASDGDLFDCVTAWLPGKPHASVIMLPGQRMNGRMFMNGAAPVPLRVIGVVGDRIRVNAISSRRRAKGQEATRQVFGDLTVEQLSALRVVVVGASGTGSLVIEQLIRAGVGVLIVIDDDVVLERNLNRIVNSTVEDARLEVPKVKVVERTAILTGTGTRVIPVPTSLLDLQALRLAASADVMFGCVDTVLARAVMNRIATFHTQPYFDLGVRIDADGQGGVEYVGGAVHYLQPGRSTLQSRGVLDDERLRAEWLALTDPKSLERLRGDGYLKGYANQKPVVMPLNMQTAGTAVLEFLARLHGFRVVPDREFAVHGGSTSHGITFNEAEPPGSGPLAEDVGRGTTSPLLGLPGLDAWLNRGTHKQVANC